MTLGVPKTRAEVKDLQLLRQLFLDAPSQQGVQDYWSDDRLLQLYDDTYARRIAWKWDAVLADLGVRGWTPGSSISRIIDWGCGSGVASERYLAHYASVSSAALLVSDRSARARHFTERKLKTQNTNLNISSAPPDTIVTEPSDLVLLSHVLTELTESQFEKLLGSIEKAHCLVWVEPGTPFCSQRLIQVREQLKENFAVIAPCPHQRSCGLINSNKDWCHFFANPPGEIFQSSDWMLFAKELNIDLRSLPVSYLVLQRNKNALAAQSNRVIGRPRFYKGHGKFLVCRADGVKEESLQERNHKADFKTWQKDCFSVQITSAADSD